jgi:hypothetical protein
MKAKSIRLPQELLDTVKYAGEKEKLDEPTALRKLLKLGAERYVGALYRKGEMTLRDAAHVLGLPLRDTMELLLDMGIAGNVSAAQAWKSLDYLKTLKK